MTLGTQCPSTEITSWHAGHQCDGCPTDRLGTHKQLADVHLPALAAMRKGRLVTFDRGIANALRPADRAIIELLPIT